MDFLFDNVNLTGGFLKEKQNLNLKTTIYAVYDRFKETGRFDALWCKWREGCKEIPKPNLYWDSDVAKWIEGASYIIAKTPCKDLEEKIEQAIDAMEKNQWDDGYINSYYTVVEPENRFTVRNNHELYCAGHLMEAAVAYYYATGKDRFLKMMEKYADLINKVFVEDKSAAFATPGHEEIELALMRMYYCTKNKKYLDMCRYFISARGANDKDGELNEHFKLNYDQADIPLAKLFEAQGHAVRAGYIYTAMAEFAGEVGDGKLLDACGRLFDDITSKKMYISGGIGSSRVGEAFTVAYDLPSETAYTETCAAISLMLFAHSLFKNEQNSKYADVIERILYNGMMSGLSLSGDKFFYENPLEINVVNRYKNIATHDFERYPITQRVKVFSVSCCPPNINRVLSSVEKYVYYVKGDVCYVNQYCSSQFKNDTAEILQETNYPVSGKIKIKAKGLSKIALRIPAWCDKFEINADYVVKNGYAFIENPEEIELLLDITPKLYSANAEVSCCSNKAALMLGPVLYCAEGVDNGVNLHRLYLNKKLNFKTEYNDEYKLNTIELDGYLRSSSDSLYETLNENFEERKIKMIPYNSFANRGESDMIVWMNYR